jgi:hypothetical protein
MAIRKTLAAVLLLIGALSAQTNIGPTAMPQLALGPYTIAAGPNQLPAAAQWTNYMTTVTDASSTANCTAGGGVIVMICISQAGAWVPMTGTGVSTFVNWASPGAIGATTPNSGAFTSVNNVVNPMTYSGADIGAKINAAIAAACTGLQCTILIPPQAAQLTFSTGIVLGNNQTLECSRGGQITNTTLTNQALSYTGTGSAVTMNGYGARVIGCDFLLGSSAAEGARLGGYSNFLDDVGFTGGGTSTILAHVSGTSAEDNHIQFSRFSNFTGVGVQCDHANDTYLESTSMYGTVGNNTGLGIVIDSNCGGFMANNIPIGNAGLHGVVIRRTLGGTYPLSMFFHNVQVDLSTSDCWLFDSTLGSANLIATLNNIWAAGCGGNGISVQGGSWIHVGSGSNIRANQKSGVLINGTNAEYDVIIADSFILGNNQVNSTYSGVDIINHPAATNIVNNQIGNAPEVGGHQVYGINAASDVEGLVIANNNLGYNATGPLTTAAVTASKLTVIGNDNAGSTAPASVIPGTLTVNDTLTALNGIQLNGTGPITAGAGAALSLRGNGAASDMAVQNNARTLNTLQVNDNGDTYVLGKLFAGGGRQLTDASGYLQAAQLNATLGVAPYAALCTGGTGGGEKAVTDGGTCINTVTVATPTVGQAACIYAAGPPVQIGKCTSAVGAGGACTCAP